MTLTWPIVCVVLAGALLHAGWNALIKSGTDKELDTALVHLSGSLLALPALLWAGLPAPEAWPFIAASMAVHLFYFIALVGAYRHGDLGLTYPIMRGCAPLLVALASGALFGETLSSAAWFGIFAVAAGVILVGFTKPGAGGNHRKALWFAAGNALVIALYTVIDGQGVRHAAGALNYVLALFVLNGPPYAALVYWRRAPAERPKLIDYARRRWPIACLGGIASFASYAIALWAMTRAPVASVAALRETSVLFAALLGVWILKEPYGTQRALGTAAVVAGIAALKIA